MIIATTLPEEQSFLQFVVLKVVKLLPSARSPVPTLRFVVAFMRSVSIVEGSLNYVLSTATFEQHCKSTSRVQEREMKAT
jgi:hypothetical protein